MPAASGQRSLGNRLMQSALDIIVAPGQLREGREVPWAPPRRGSLCFRSKRQIDSDGASLLTIPVFMYGVSLGHSALQRSFSLPARIVWIGNLPGIDHRPAAEAAVAERFERGFDVDVTLAAGEVF